jgi:hypothetical protein
MLATTKHDRYSCTQDDLQGAAWGVCAFVCFATDGGVGEV